jgi:tetratricopeptide (TPR) repeat protein
VSGRTALLLTLFVGLAAFGLLRSLRKRNRWWWLVALPAFGLALLSKETAILFPLLVALAPLLTQTRFDRYHWLLVGATLAIAAGYLLLRSGAVPVTIPVEARVGFWPRLAAAANTFGLYVRMFFWPFEHRAKYPATTAFFTATPSILAGLLFAVSVPLLSLRRRFSVTLWGFVWTVAFLLPVSNLVSIGPLAAERLLYLPSAGIVMVVVTALSRLLSARATLRQLAAACLAGAIVLLGADSMIRARVWESAETLFSAMVREAPEAPSAYANLADAIADSRPDSALVLYDRALALDQGYVHAHMHAARLFSAKRDHRRALHHLRLANELRPNSTSVLNNLGLAFAAAGETDSALAAFDRALAGEPGSAPLRVNRASTFIAAGRQEEAAEELHRALELDSALPAARSMLADILKAQGRFDSAIVLMQQVVGQLPAAPSLNRLGSLWVSAGDSARARACYEQALRLDSTCVPALYNLSILYAASGESAAARVLASRAFRLRPDLEAVRELDQHLSPPPAPRP